MNALDDMKLVCPATVTNPPVYPLEQSVLLVHDPEYVSWLRQVYAEWKKRDFTAEFGSPDTGFVTDTFAVRTMARKPKDLLWYRYYCSSVECCWLFCGFVFVRCDKLTYFFGDVVNLMSSLAGKLDFGASTATRLFSSTPMRYIPNHSSAL